MFREPGFYVLLILFIATALQLIATLLLQSRWKAFAVKVDDLRSKPDLTNADRAWLALLVSEATDRRAVWLLAVIAPLVAPAVLILSVIEALKYRHQSLDQAVARIENEAAALQAAGVADLGYDIKDARYWSSPIRVELRYEADFLQWFSAPVPALIASVSLYPALLPSVLITYCSQAIRRSSMESFGHLFSAKITRSLHRLPS